MRQIPYTQKVYSSHTRPPIRVKSSLYCLPIAVCSPFDRRGTNCLYKGRQSSRLNVYHREESYVCVCLNCIGLDHVLSTSISPPFFVLYMGREQERAFNIQTVCMRSSRWQRTLRAQMLVRLWRNVIDIDCVLVNYNW